MTERAELTDGEVAELAKRWRQQVVVRPGDTLVLLTDPDFSDEGLDFIARLRDEGGPLQDVTIVVIANAKQALVYRPDADSDPG